MALPVAFAGRGLSDLGRPSEARLTGKDRSEGAWTDHVDRFANSASKIGFSQGQIKKILIDQLFPLIEKERIEKEVNQLFSIGIECFDDDEDTTQPIPVSDLVLDLNSTDLVQGLLQFKTTAQVLGKPSCGKSNWVIHAAMSICQGIPLHGKRTEKSAVLYCPFEGFEGTKRRLLAYMKEYGVSPENLPFELSRRKFNLLQPGSEGIEKLISDAKKLQAKYDLQVGAIIIDTLNLAAAGMDENSSKDMGLVIKSLKLIAEATGACALVVHHTGKDASKGARGHSSSEGAADTVLSITHDGKSPIREVRNPKQRDFETDSGFAFRINSVPLGKNKYGEIVTAPVAVPVSLITKQRTVYKGSGAAMALEELRELSAPDSVENVFGGTKKVQLSEWKDRFVANLPVDLEPKRQTENFEKAVTSLVAKRICDRDETFAWLLE